MTYFFVGEVMQITKPMLDEDITRGLTWLSIWSRIIMLGSFGLLFYYCFFGEHRGLSGSLLSQFLEPLTLVEMTGATIFKFLLTTTVGVDFMIQEIADQRSFECFLENPSLNMGNDGVSVRRLAKGFNEMDSRKIERFRTMLHAKNARLDDLCEAVRKKNPTLE